MLTKEKLFRLFSRVPTLYTSRLILRKMEMSDVDDMFDYASRPETTQYLMWSPHPDRFYTADYLHYVAAQYAAGNFYDWAVISRDDKKMIGTCGFTRFHTADNAAEVGYVLNPDYWGKGIAAEALSEVLRFGFEDLALHRIEARYMVENTASRRVMEKVGMVYEGTARDALFVKGRFRTVGTCAILDEEFKRR